MAMQCFDEFFRAAPPEVDVEGIRRRWRALKPPYQVDNWTLPLPVWAKRGYSETGAEAWDILHHQLYASTALRPFCVYLHVPFCSSKCGFCDSYSFKLGRRKSEHIDEYVGLLEQELEVWSQRGNLSQRPVRTVHFGGGTPSFMGVGPFSRIVTRCKEQLAVTPETEWALESTVTHLGAEMLACLHELGFRRLHVGVQSLEDLVRKHIGRRQTAAKALAKIAEIVGMGWVVSVDLICGLPDQTLGGFLEGIKRLWKAGVHGFSLYELLIYPQNRKWAERYGLTERTHLANYWVFQAGASYLGALGYKKNLFNHWANGRDENLYFTFPTRGEDLLALGAIADGVFGDYHYRHVGYSRYRRIASEQFPGLEGGTRRNSLENALHPLTTAILAGGLPPALAPALETIGPDGGESLLQRWLELELIEEQGGHLYLTPSGSWFAGNMVSELVARFHHSG
jgi:coproporphyrinogen III oxidase-like Fe-S oxidoreductase